MPTPEHQPAEHEEGREIGCEVREIGVDKRRGENPDEPTRGPRHDGELRGGGF
jgi:hypothetical protein